jgi:DNA-binding response OmpR family regulator
MTVRRILIADDDPVMTKMLSSALTERRYEFVIAADAMQAVMFAVQKLPDAIILDINMPAGTGHVALKRLKASARTASIPVIVLSGSTDVTLPARVRAEGAIAIFRKPVDLDALFARIEELLSRPAVDEHASPHAAR